MDLFKISILNKILKLSNKSILEKKILEKSKQPGRFVSNLGGYQSHNLDIEDQDLKELITKLNTEVSHLANYYEFKDELKVKEIWFNTNRYKDILVCTYAIDHENSYPIISLIVVVIFIIALILSRHLYI